MITRRTTFVAGAALAAGLAIGFVGSALAANPAVSTGYHTMMGGGGMMGGGHGAGIMGAANWNVGVRPGAAGFVAGTTDSPRVIHIVAGPGYTFSPSSIAVERVETVTFVVTTVGPLVHEFMVGPADAVAADQQGTPEIAAIGMMQTKSLTYTFDGSGPYAFACHTAGHYEAGMRGTISVVG